MDAVEDLIRDNGGLRSSDKDLALCETIDRSVAALKWESRQATAVGRHSHPKAQLLHAIAGVFKVQCEQGVWVVPPGRAVWMPAHIDHGTTPVGPVIGRSLFVNDKASLSMPASCRVVDVSPLLRELIVAAAEIPLDDPLRGREQRIMELILDELRILPIIALTLPFPKDEKLRRLCARLMRHLDAPVSHSDCAAFLDICERTLSRLFQKELKMSFGQWHRRARLIASLDALAAGESVISVSLSLGYATPSAFTAMFRRTLGVSPSDYFGWRGRPH